MALLPKVLLVCLAFLVAVGAAEDTALQREQPQSLQTLLLGRLVLSRWTRIIPQPNPTKIVPTPSILSLVNLTGFADTYFAYHRTEETAEMPISHLANLLIVRLYDSPYINTFHCQVRVPLANYSEQQRRWKAEGKATITFYNHSTKLGSFEKSLSYDIDDEKIRLQLSSDETLLLREDKERTVKLFPIIYVALLCGIIGLFQRYGGDSQTTKRVSPLMVVVMAIKMLSRSTFFLTQSFLAPTPYGWLMLLLTLLNTLVMLQFVHYFSFCFRMKKQNRAAVIILIVLIGVQILLVFNPYYNCLASLLPMMQVLANTTTKRNAKSQTCFIGYFIVHSSMVVYYTLDGDNLFRIEPVRWAAYIIIASVVLQLIVLKCQEKQVQIRRWFHKPPEMSESTIRELAEKDCPICLCSIGSEPYLITKCSHVFHEECLRCWTEIRNVCPLDRQIISKEFLEEA